ncbi:uncharacterized protein LOC131947710 [Physella acuta]|uniref:uncharacterized protein LOC131947710 n=1 Tax=Physella acuta TaxID=109671 RepID=UPI0027DD3741|nr:uncharacterized protein LOC131947710 [Physella acuta]
MSLLHVILVCLPLLALGQDLTAIAYESFRRIDANNDGRVTKPEVLDYFDDYDLNNDGHVTKVEYGQRVDSVFHDPTVNQVLHRIFPGLDIDNNNILNNADYDDIFAIADANNNGQITQDEFDRYFKIIAT